MDQRRRPVSETQIAVFALCASGVWTAGNAGTPGPFPVACSAAAACGKGGPTQWVTGGAATMSQGPNALNINQSTNTAILNWSSFNIAAGNSVNFQQPSINAIALNRIFQDSPSQIFGNLNANGQVYLLNQNGILFGSTSQVNVGGLLAATLPLNAKLTDAAINSGQGILSPETSAYGASFDATADRLAPGGRKVVLDANGSPILDTHGNPIPVQLTVQPGAQITAADQQHVLLVGQGVNNGGTITAPDGQIILAAGSKVYLQASSDPNLRGLVVAVEQVDQAPGDDKSQNLAWNQLTGVLSSPRGNVTMVGLAVNQEGRISATTSTSANGSIRLEAGVVSGTPVSSSYLPAIGGTLTVGSQSEMDILPELSAGESDVPGDVQPQSSVMLVGEQVFLKGGSIVAPSGNLTAVASNNPGNGVTTSDPNARLRIDPGVSIDLSGSSATLPVSTNLVAAQLRSSELANDPTQRNGVLHGQTVYVDARNLPSASLADFSGDVGAVKNSLAQRTETGGSASIQSSGDLVFSQGAQINVSGGSTTYTGGVMQSSYLIGANGKLYPIATANPLLTYVGVLNPNFSQTFDKWGVKEVLPTPGLSSYQAGYVQGAPAGQVQFVAPSMVLQGSLQGNAVNGLYQRAPGKQVAGGHLIIGLPGGISATNNLLADYTAPAVELTRDMLPIVTSDDTALPDQLTLSLPTAYLTNSGFTSTQIYSNHDVTLPAGPTLSLPAGSVLSVNAARVNLLAGITDPGGQLSFNSVYNQESASYYGAPAIGVPPNTAFARPGVYVSDGLTFDVSGLWTNDMQIAGGSGTAQTWQNGGSITLWSNTPDGLLSIGNNVSLLANGGAWIKANGAIAGGTGGSIKLRADYEQSGFDVGRGLTIAGFGTQGALGGTFELGAPRLAISNGSSAWTEAQQVDDLPAAGSSSTPNTGVTTAPPSAFQLYSGLFSNYGFQFFTLNSGSMLASGAVDRSVLSIDPGTSIQATVGTQYLSSRAYLAPSASLEALATTTILPEYLRGAANITLKAIPTTIWNPPLNLGVPVTGDIVVGTGASIGTDASGAINLTGLGSLIVDGELSAPGGQVALHILSPQHNDPRQYEAFDMGFVADQRIDLGPGSVINVSGTFVPQPATNTNLHLTLGQLYGGGGVSLLADRGAVVAERGSFVDVAGSNAAMDVPQPDSTYGHELAASAGGNLTVRSAESIFLLGGINAAAGAPGTSGVAAAGSLEIDLTRSVAFSDVPNQGFSTGPMVVQLVPQQSATIGVPTLLFNSNQAVLGAADLSQWGFDALRILADNSINVSGDFSLALNRSISLNAPVIATASGAQASLSAPYMEVGYAQGTNAVTNSNLPTAGTGKVQFSGSEIDLFGDTVFQNAAEVTFASSGDIVLRGQNTTDFAGSISVAQTLTLQAARIYPVTGTSFNLNAGLPPDANGSAIDGSVIVGAGISGGGLSADPGTPLSAAGSLTVNAANITDDGRLYAPFGQINLAATKTLSLGADSITSVSGGGLTIPYGQTTFGQTQWSYEDFSTAFAAIPPRTVTLNAPAITMASGATVDLSGGGDLFAYEWVPGSGGTRNQLSPDVSLTAATAASIPGLYAILPSTLGQSSPKDPLYSFAQNVAPGTSVYLSGGDGLTAGFYPLLPAFYALVPGAVLIQIQPKMLSTAAGSLGTLADGTPLLAGYLSYGSTGLHQTPGYTGFAIYPSGYVSKLAEYDLSTASKFYQLAATLAGDPRPNLPADAAELSINVGSLLDLSGNVQTAAATGGRNATIEISASDLVVGRPATAAPSGAVQIEGDALSNWHPGSLILGGRSQTDAKGNTTLTVQANSVTLGDGANLSADQLILVASQSIDVESGAMVRTTSSASGTPPSTAPAVSSVTFTDGNAATTAGMLAISDTRWLIPTAAASGGTATVTVESGASVASRGSLSIHSPGVATLADNTLTGSGAEWSLSSSGIALLGNSPSDNLTISSALLGQLNTASAVRLASTGSIDIMAATNLGVDGSGKAFLKSLTLSAANLNNQAGTAGTQLGAQTLTLEGASASGPAGTAGATGSSLTLTAGELDIGPNTFTVNNFADTTATVSGVVLGKGSGGLNIGGNLTVGAAGVTADAAADTGINAGGTLKVAAANGNNATTPLGGLLTLSGSSVEIDGKVTATSGIININSTAGDVDIASGALVSTAGQVVSIGNQAAATPGGSIVINSAGNLTLASGATLDVSGAALAAASNGGADAGSVRLTSGTAIGNAVTLGATFNGAAGGARAAGGSFSVNANSLVAPSPGGNPLTTLASALTSGGFTNSIDIRDRTDALDLDSASTLTANSVSLTADSGMLTLGGKIVAQSGDLRGRITVFGGKGVELQSGAVLDAGASGSSSRGGIIEIGAGQLTADANGVLDVYNNASIQLDSGSIISANGTAAKGTLLLRAPALTAGTNDVAIGPISSDTSGLGGIIVEPVMPFGVSTNTDLTTVQQSVSNYMSTASSAVATRLAGTQAPLMVEAGAELIASDPAGLTLPALDLSTWHSGAGAPIDLTVRSAGDITVAQNISDGFSTLTGQLTLTNGLSSSIRLVAGADLSSANPLAAVSNVGNLNIGPGAIVRTGTGDIDLVAGNNIDIQAAGSGAYTAGLPNIAPISPAQGTPYVDSSGQNVGIVVTGSSLLMSFPSNGGNLRVAAGNDVVGAALTAYRNKASGVDGPSVSDWQLREGSNINTQAQPVWGVNLQAYDWNFGTLGGGDLQLTAGHDATDVTAAAADSLLPANGSGSLQYLRSGGLSFTAGNDIGSAQIFLADGTGKAQAGRGLTRTTAANVGSAFYLQTSALEVISRLDMVVDGVFNPTTLGQSVPANNKTMLGGFLSYDDNSALSLQSLAGDVLLGTTANAAQTLLGQTANKAVASGVNKVLPPSLSVSSLFGDIDIGSSDPAQGANLGRSGNIVLAPSPNGQLDLLAAKDINANAQGSLRMADALAGSYASVASPFANGDLASLRYTTDIHAADTAPALVTAGGNIYNLNVSIPKPAQFVAGKDITYLNYTGQNLTANDTTLISAGRDLIYSPSDPHPGISLGGPGNLDIIAGRNVSLGGGQGILTTGNLQNPGLPTAQGANITIVTGQDTPPDFAGFLSSIVAPSSTYQSELESYVESLDGSSGLTFAAAENRFAALTQPQQQYLIDKVFFNELLLSGRAKNADPTTNFKQGYAAIDALFPGSRTGSAGATDNGVYAGDLSLSFTQIYTLSGGDINLVVPGGFTQPNESPRGIIDVGLANPPSTSVTKAPSQLGIVAEGPGNVNIYAKSDVNVNASRIFTLGGGNILIWSDEGNIDAGKGAKSAISAPPPTISINPDNGQPTINFAGAAQGSGIRTIQTNPDQALGSVDLIAPVGSIDAGDAGIGAAGNINLAARAVVGVDNISFGGSAAGVPAEVGNLGASLSSASSAGSGATSSATSAAEAAQRAAEQASTAPLAQTALSWLDVFVTGLGEENCKTDDLECLKRQKTNLN